MSSSDGATARPTWTFLTNHAHVLICLAQDPHARIRDIAERVGVTERAVQQLINDLVGASVLTRHREGRRNRYTIDGSARLRHPLEAHRTVTSLIEMVGGDDVAPADGVAAAS